MASDKEVQMIMTLTGVDEKTAEDAYMRYEDVTDAIDALLQKPVVSGEKYIPVKPKIDTGMSPEQEELCQRGRWLQDQVNVVFSVAHSKVRTQQSEAPEGHSEESPALSVPIVEGSQSQQGAAGKTTQPILLSETPQ